MKKPLEGLVMLDLTRVLAGPFCSMVLADLGVEVIKIEIPGQGDDSRRYPPFIHNESAYFMSLNRNKKSLTLNLKSERGREILLGLVKKADILLENFRPGTLERLNLGKDVLLTENPGLIYAACSGYGHSGPYMNRPAYDMIVQAMGGIMSITGTDEDHPVRVGSSIGDIVAGLYTAIGILAAIHGRAADKRGQMVDVAMLDCQIAILENAISRYLVTGVDPKPIGNRHPSISPFAQYKTADKKIVIAAGNDTLFGKLCNVISRPGLGTDERYLTNELRVTNMNSLNYEIEEALLEGNSEYWLKKLNDSGIPCGPINKISEAISDPQVLARDMIVEVTNTRGESFMVPGNPVKLSETPCEVEKGAPLLGEHNREILQKFLGLRDEEINSLGDGGII